MWTEQRSGCVGSDGKTTPERIMKARTSRNNRVGGSQRSVNTALLTD